MNRHRDSPRFLLDGGRTFYSVNCDISVSSISLHATLNLLGNLPREAAELNGPHTNQRNRHCCALIPVDLLCGCRSPNYLSIRGILRINRLTLHSTLRMPKLSFLV
ncbi:unnamed protein product [Natator depressus]